MPGYHNCDVVRVHWSNVRAAVVPVAWLVCTKRCLLLFVNRSDGCYCNTRVRRRIVFRWHSVSRCVWLRQFRGHVFALRWWPCCLMHCSVTATVISTNTTAVEFEFKYVHVVHWVNHVSTACKSHRRMDTVRLRTQYMVQCVLCI